MLESQRGFLLLAFAAVSFFLFTEWQDLQTAKLKPIAAPAPSSILETSSNLELPQANVNTDATAGSEVPSLEAPAIEVPTAIQANSARYVEVVTDTLRLVIDTKGGDIVESDLLKFKETLEADSKPVRIHSNTGKVYIATSGVVGKGAPDSTGDRASYVSEKAKYEMGDADTLAVPLLYQNAEGVRFSKTFEFSRGSHAATVKFGVDNQSANTFAGSVFTQLKRQAESASGMMGMSAYVGGSYGTQDKKFEKYTFDDIAENATELKAQGGWKLNTTGGWVSYLQHYFISAWVPDASLDNKLYSTVVNGGEYILGVQQPTFTVAAGQQHESVATLYIGPKVQDDLEKIAKGLDLTVDYGFLWWIGQPLFWLLTYLYSWLGNWGVAIILVTILVKILLFPLANAQYRSFAKMRLLAPKMQALKEKHGDDRQAMSQAMMELYRKEKANPLGGCFPILLTMPVFLALYWVLMESVELRHAPFMLWIHDLSVMDPYFVLPVLMGISMWVTQKMQPVSPTMDPMQQKMMQYLPVIMSVFFLWFPAGLVLYWLVNNLISIGQQWIITKQFEAETAKKK